MDKYKKNYFIAAACSHIRAVEYYVQSLIVDVNRRIYEIFLSPDEVDEFAPEYDAVRCTWPAQFNVFIDKVKIGKLQCFPLNDDVLEKPVMGINMKPNFHDGNYYLVTNSEALGKNGTQPYIDGTAPAEDMNFQ